MASDAMARVLRKHKPFLISLYIRIACLEEKNRHHRTVSMAEWLSLVRELKLTDGGMSAKDAQALFARASGGGEVLLPALRNPPGAGPLLVPLLSTDVAARATGEEEEEEEVELGFAEFVEALVSVACFFDRDPFSPLSSRTNRFIEDVLKALDRAPRNKTRRGARRG